VDLGRLNPYEDWLLVYGLHNQGNKVQGQETFSFIHSILTMRSTQGTRVSGAVSMGLKITVI
jgi:hypothetical protein